MKNMDVTVGRRYSTKGGWTAFIYTKGYGNPQGWCTDKHGNEESSMGTWDEKTGKCLQRGHSDNILNTEPFDLIAEID